MRTIGLPLAALALVLVTVPAHAEVGVGILGGVNIATLESNDEEFGDAMESKRFAVGGIVLDFPLSEAVSLRLEPMYMPKGTTATLEVEGFNFESTLRLPYVELPILLKVSRTTGAVRPYLVIGPSIGYRTGATATDVLTGEEEDVEDADDIETWDYGVAAGGGLSYAVGRATIFAEGRYTLGLADLDKQPDAGETLKNRGVQILARFTVPVGR